MTKQVRETAAGQSISAYIVLNKKGQHVATVQMHYGSSAVTVDIWHEASNHCPLQQGRASGYGYDKRTAALSGLVIDGHVMTDHCSREGAPRIPKGLKRYPSDFKVKPGYSLANYQSRFITFGFDPTLHEREGFEGNDGYESCYRLPGLEYLSAIGYRVLQAI